MTHIECTESDAHKDESYTKSFQPLSMYKNVFTKKPANKCKERQTRQTQFTAFVRFLRTGKEEQFNRFLLTYLSMFFK